MARSQKSNRQAFGNVRKLPSGRFQAAYSIEGERFTAPATFDTKAEAHAWLAGEQADRARGVWHDARAGAVTLADYAETWLESRDLAPRTHALYRQQLDRWILPELHTAAGKRVALGAVTLADLEPVKIRAWLGIVHALAAERAAERAARTPARTGHPARAWALARGLNVAPTGRLSPAIMSAWRAAGAPSLPPAPPKQAPRVAGNAPGSTVAASVYRLLHAILTTATDDGLIPANPARVKGAARIKTPRRRPASAAEVAALAEHMPPRRRAALIVAAWSGLRSGELFALARRHVDLDAGQLHVERALEHVQGQPWRFGEPKTEGSHRTVNLPPAIVAVLREHMEQYTDPDPDALVFIMPSGHPVSSRVLSDDMRRACEGAGLPRMRWHDLRHTGATLAYQVGASVPDVQARLGHTTMRAAMIYAHTAADADRALAERLDALVMTPRRAPGHGAESAHVGHPRAMTA